jgi:hypothetical protein
MTTDTLHTPEGRAAAFATFRAKPYSRFITKLRQWRAEQIRELFDTPLAMNLDRFNRQIWQIGSKILLRGTPIAERIFDQDPGDTRVAELETALDAGELTVEGNTLWHPGSSVFGSSLKEDIATKEEHIRRAFTILTDVKLAPFEQVDRIVRIPGLKQSAATMLVMIAAPTAWALDNERSRSALKLLGFPAETGTEVQVSTSQLRDELGADDLLELDLFLYQLDRQTTTIPISPQIWWVNQGGSYKQDKADSIIQANLKGADGRRVPAREAVGQVHPGDIIMHHFQKYLRAVSKVQSEPYLAADNDGEQLRRADTAYHELITPIPCSSVAQAIYDLDIPAGPIGKDLAPKQGYLHTLPNEGLRIIYDTSPTNNWPAYVTDLLGISSGGETPTNGVGPKAAPGITLPPPYERLVDALRHTGLFFSPEVVSDYLLALQTKGFVILTGISGTGKTQLALEIAKHFQPTLRQTITAKPPDGARSYTVQKYTYQHNQMVLPVDVVDELGLSPDNLSTNNDIISVYFPGGSTPHHIYKYPSKNTLKLVFKDQFRTWFRANLRPGDIFFLEVVPTDTADVNALRFSVPLATTQVRRLANYKVIAVRPDWTDNRGLLGYYNPLTGRYESTPFLRFLLDAQAESERAARESRPPHPYFLILDEMNLARVEYYFADFLSCLESGEPLELHDDREIEAGLAAETEQLPVPRSLRVPRNLLFTGTVNVDETTSMFSPKVLDRAFTIEFNQVDLANFGVPTSLDSTADTFAVTALPERLILPGKVTSDDWVALGGLEGGTLRQLVIGLNDVLTSEQRQFGYRVANEVARFVNLAAIQVDATSYALWAALDLAILAKALPKLYGTQQELESILAQLFCFALHGKLSAPLAIETILSQWRDQGGQIAALVVDESVILARLPRTAAKLWRMLRRLRQQGFTAFVC